MKFILIAFLTLMPQLNILKLLRYSIDYITISLHRDCYIVDSLTTWHLTTVEDTNLKSEQQIHDFKMVVRIRRVVMLKIT